VFSKAIHSARMCIRVIFRLEYYSRGKSELPNYESMLDNSEKDHNIHEHAVDRLILVRRSQNS
jgi:hypothetical protein